MDEIGDLIAFQPREGVEVRHLRAFIAVAEELNFSRAAERLYVTQPALSRQIRTLERAVGCELLRRSTHRVELTLAGSALLDRSRAVLAALDDAVTAARSVGGELNARIMNLWAPMMAVSTPDASIQTMRDVFEAFLARIPMPELAVRPTNARGVPALGLGEKPSILYLHGGNYTMGSAYGYRPLAGALVEAAGRGALVPDYRLAPEHPFPAALEDALAAYNWLVERSGSPANVALAGDSSGAALALAVLLSLKAAGQPMPAGAALLCPLLDMTGAMLEPAVIPDPMDEVGRAADAYLDGHSIEDPLVSPLHSDLAGLPPLLVQSATGDRARPEAEALVERAAKHGVSARLELFAAETHVFHVFASFLPEARDALAQAGQFVREALAFDPASASPAG